MSYEDNMAAQNRPNQSPLDIDALALELPPFCVESPCLWFIRIESQFYIAGITQDLIKYHAVIIALDAEILNYVSDIIFKPPKENLYETLKHRILREVSDRKQTRIKSALSELTLGDNKPSHLLRKMRQLADLKVEDDYLKIIFLQRLPKEVRNIVSVVSDDGLDKLAAMADRIVDVLTPAKADVHTVQSGQSPDIQALNQKIDELAEQVKRLSCSRRRRRRRRPRSTSRNRASSRSSCSSAPYWPGRDLCWYHQTFGFQARYCRQPCSF